jgi:DNA polymerase III epsilon subunit-like protein
MNHSKLFFFDVETSGLDPVRNDILSLSYIIEINSVVRKRDTIYIQPLDWTALDPGALMVNGLTVDKLSNPPFVEPLYAHAMLIDALSLYVDRYDSSDKFYPVAFNSRFDTGFLSAFFTKCEDPFFGSWFNGKELDPLPILRFLDYLDVLSFPNYKLLTVAQYLGFAHQAHDAASDVDVLHKIFHRISSIFNRTYFITCLQEEKNGDNPSQQS